MRILLSCVVAGTLGSLPLVAAEQSWTGQISDSKCGTKHSPAEHGKKSLSDRECALVCAQKGAEYVLVADGKVYKLRNHDADLKAHAGDTVKVAGELSGETIRVSKIEMSKGTK
ncbi:MAG TPA: DUF5818 domain-containing protein [Vicinamibacterales bacterium]|nr:DUF5818 domain-containing protein [Vicinamibacterales bacterium]